jgi:type II secretory pathway pseudopilin PulG
MVAVMMLSLTGKIQPGEKKMQRTVNPLHTAFTLLEIAIILAIIGLLAGGVLAGQEMIRAAQLQKTVKQISDINQASVAFRDQYAGYPGDIRNAASFWAGAANGNGNGSIETAANGTCVVTNAKQASDLDCADFTGERAQFFTQLGLSGLGTSYDGSTTVGTGYPAISASSGAGIIVGSTWLTAAASNMRMENYINSSVYLYLGVCRPSTLNTNSAAEFNNCGTLIPIDAQHIDTKIDDGKPLSGTVFGQSYNTICATGTAANTTSVVANNSYNISVSAPGCNLLVNLGE